MTDNMPKPERIKRLAVASAQLMARARYEFNLNADDTCAVCAIALLKQAELAGIKRDHVGDWLRHLAEQVDPEQPLDPANLN